MPSTLRAQTVASMSAMCAVFFRCLVVLSLAALASCGGGAATDGRVIPLGEFEAHELSVEMSPEMVSIMARFRASVAVNAEWFRDYIHQFPEADTNDPFGSALPFHENFGIREEEYEQLLDFMKNDMQEYQEVRPFSMEVSGSEDRLRIVSAGRYEALVGITFDFEADQVETPWGTLTGSEPKVLTKNEKPAGPFEGRIWTLEEGDAEAAIFDGEGVARFLRFMIGERENGRKGHLYAMLRVIDQGEVLVNETIVLQWDL